jgi:hypothetical protein
MVNNFEVLGTLQKVESSIIFKVKQQNPYTFVFHKAGSLPFEISLEKGCQVYAYGVKKSPH